MNNIGEKLGKYTLERMIGAGPHGKIYRAVLHGAAGFERDFAVKKFQEDIFAGREVTTQLAETMRGYGTLEHPRIARLLDYGMADGIPFAAIELINGIDLSIVLEHTLEKGKPMLPGIRAWILSSVARAVGYAHSRSVMHSGIKPTNIVCTAEGQIKVTDFGVTGTHLSTNTNALETLKSVSRYLAPEQVAQVAQVSQTHPQTDVFQLGLLAHALFGAYGEVHPVSLAQDAIANDRQPPLPGVSKNYLSIVRKALSSDIADRYPTARAMADALDGVVRNDPMPGGKQEFVVLIKTLVESLGVSQVDTQIAVQDISLLNETIQQSDLAESATENFEELVDDDGELSDQIMELSDEKTEVSPPAFANATKGFIQTSSVTAQPIDAVLNDKQDLSSILTETKSSPPPTPEASPLISKPEQETVVRSLSKSSLSDDSLASTSATVTSIPTDSFAPTKPSSAPVHVESFVTASSRNDLTARISSATEKVMQNRRWPIVVPTAVLTLILGVFALRSLGPDPTTQNAAATDSRALGATNNQGPVVTTDNDNKQSIDKPDSVTNITQATTIDNNTSNTVQPKVVSQDVARLASATNEKGSTQSTKPITQSFSFKTLPKSVVIHYQGKRLLRDSPIVVDDSGQKLVVYAPGHSIKIIDVAETKIEDPLTLSPIKKFRGAAGLRVLCKKKNRYYVRIDGQDTGMLCPTGRLGMKKGTHKVELINVKDGSNISKTVSIRSTKKSKRIRF